MFRNIKVLSDFEPPATYEESHAASLQLVRKVGKSPKPSQANEELFKRAVEEVSHKLQCRLDSLVTMVTPCDREVEVAKVREWAAKRFPRSA